MPCLLSRSSRSTGKAGRVPLWIPLGIVVLGMALGVARLSERVARAEYARVQTQRVQAVFDAPWADPRWRVELDGRIAAHAPFAPDDGSAVRALLADVQRLSFVGDVARPRVVWPDGVEFWVRLRKPVACVQVGVKYLPVAEDGTLLSGAWTAPPRSGSGYLPVIGPNDGSFDGWEPAMRLVEERHLDALAIARSLWERLPPSSREGLGRTLIDASRARATSVAEPGARILLEGDRTIWFGRSPESDAPGELPAAVKWQHVELALRLLDEGRPDGDWALLDVRWDDPEMRVRGTTVGADGAR